jgi:hypothetical protein
MKVVRLSTISTGCLYPRRYPFDLFLLEADSTPVDGAAARIKSKKSSTDDPNGK